MNKPINILDKDYLQWVSELSKRYRQSQVKVAIKVNTEMLKFYWSLGRDIVALKAEVRWGSKFLANLSRDLKEQNPIRECVHYTDKNSSSTWGANQEGYFLYALGTSQTVD